jgi:hypothetical protein
VLATVVDLPLKLFATAPSIHPRGVHIRIMVYLYFLSRDDSYLVVNGVSRQGRLPVLLDVALM